MPNVPAPVKTIAATGVELPLAFADLHRSVEIGRDIRIEGTAPVDDPSAPSWEALVHGGGFVASRPRGVYRRARSLPDYVGPAMQVLLVGLNPSPYSADVGVGFARPGNRFWPAMVAAGMIDPTHVRDPRRVLVDDHIGMTDLVKRATAKASEIDDDEFRKGHARVTTLVNWLQPSVVCFVGLGGWRIAADRRAVAGRQTEPMGSAIVYVMPNPSGLNAHATIGSLADHFREVQRLARG